MLGESEENGPEVIRRAGLTPSWSPRGDLGMHEPIAGGDLSLRRAGRQGRPVLASCRSPGSTCPHALVAGGDPRRHEPVARGDLSSHHAGRRGDPSLLGKTVRDVSGRELHLAPFFYKDLFFPNFSCFKRRSGTLFSKLPFSTPTVSPPACKFRIRSLRVSYFTFC